MRNFSKSGGAVPTVSAAIFAAVMMVGFSMSAVAADKKAPAAPKPAAPARPAAATAHPTGGGAQGAAHGTTGAGTASHGPTANGSKGPTANGPSANHPATGASANHPTTGASANHATTAGEGKAGANNASTRPGTPGNTAKAGPIKTPAPKGTTEKVAKDGSAIRTRPNGKVSDVHDAKRNMDIHHGLDGSKRVSTTRPDGSRVVSERGRGGYVQRGYSYHGHEYVSRSYYYHGAYYNNYYRGYYYGGVYVNVYSPGYYYGPGFYGWAYNPWAAPIAYGWGWGGSPWYGYYGGFFTPYSVYPSAAFWLTDYIVSANLQAAYAARAEANAAAAASSNGEAAGAAPLTPEVKQMISDEVKAQLALENSEATQTAQKQDVDPASSGIGRLLADGNPHVFVVGGSLDLTDASGAECVVTDGDALQLVPPAPPNATAVNLVVLASKGGQECAVKNTVSVQVADLQDMQNKMRETIDKGLQELQAKQGKGGLPQAPPSAQTKPTQAEFAAIAPPPDPKDAADIAAQNKAADAAESEVAADTGAAPTVDASAGGPSSAPAPTVALGQTPDEVTSILGKPTKTADLGTKKIFYYDGMKVTFKSGKVTDVE